MLHYLYNVLRPSLKCDVAHPLGREAHHCSATLIALRQKENISNL